MALYSLRPCLYPWALLTMALKGRSFTVALRTWWQVEHVMNETRILSSISHPFVTNKYAALVTRTNLLLVMEFCPGGDLFDQLYKHKSFTVPDTRIFTSQVLLPLEYLHSMSIVHRDLKLENILVSQVHYRHRHTQHTPKRTLL